MPAFVNRQIVLRRRLVESPLPAPKDGEILKAPDVFIGLRQGKSIGKLLVRVGEDPTR
ncbi:MAG TPA: hypothetical protein VNC82_19795 [Candidatus Limnocylindria bacterium]|nr:hypothetical protein [Candidatus Limnocylindria bacterium]